MHTNNCRLLHVQSVWINLVLSKSSAILCTLYLSEATRISFEAMRILNHPGDGRMECFYCTLYACVCVNRDVWFSESNNCVCVPK